MKSGYGTVSTSSPPIIPCKKSFEPLIASQELSLSSLMPCNRGSGFARADKILLVADKFCQPCQVRRACRHPTKFCEHTRCSQILSALTFVGRIRLTH